MKKVFALAVMSVCGAFIITGCETPVAEGGGGGLFGGAAGQSSYQYWDMSLVVTGLTCEKGLPQIGSGFPAPPGIAFSLPGGMFPGVRVNFSGYEYNADVPEVSTLSYYVILPGTVNAGDLIRVRYTYRAAADGLDGDYFLVRIIDGDLFRTPTHAEAGYMTINAPVNVDYSYAAQAGDFGIQFIVGLGDLGDSFYLDGLEVDLNGTPFIVDNFEAGDYTALTPLSAAVVRAPGLPTHPSGGLGLQGAVVLEGAQTLEFMGGRYFQLYGQGASMDGVSGIILTYTDPDFLDPFFGQSQAMAQGGIYLGDYLGFDHATTPACTEEGAALIAVNSIGNADLSGVWTLRLDAACEEPGVFVGETITNAVLPGDLGPVSVYKTLAFFIGWPFTNADGDVFQTFAGTSIGNAGVFILQDPGNATLAQLIGTYDKAAGTIAGQIIGSLPAAGANVCTVTQGTWFAIINGAIAVGPPAQPPPPP